jgi:hypothetical protein
VTVEVTSAVGEHPIVIAALAEAAANPRRATHINQEGTLP